MSKIKCKLERCKVRFEPTRPTHEFHSNACRAEYRRTHTPGIGEIKSLRQIKGGKWSVTIHLHEQPDVQVGQEIALSRD
jgi:hypothetical protein